MTEGQAMKKTKIFGGLLILLAVVVAVVGNLTNTAKDGD